MLRFAWRILHPSFFRFETSNMGRILTLPPERRAPPRYHLRVHDHSTCRFGNRRFHSHGVVWWRCQDASGKLPYQRTVWTGVHPLVLSTVQSCASEKRCGLKPRQRR